jgi:hypothetical protein
MPRSSSAAKPNQPSDQSARRPETSVHPVDPRVEREDPKASAVDHQQQRHVLRHNVEGGQAEEHPETPAGQHATGSFTDKQRPEANGKR